MATRASAYLSGLRSRFVTQVIDDYTGPAHAKGLSIRVRVPPQAVTISDPVLLKSVLGNLISNAVRYTENGGVLITCRPSQGEWLIDVIDTGFGIAPAQQREIFKEFVQLNKHQQNMSQGLGLGLAIVERLIRLLGHQLTLKSVPGRGSRFRITVPQSTSSPPIAVATKPGVGPLMGNALVLVIDDDELVREATCGMLAGWGLRGLSAPDAYSAMRVLINEPELPLLIISDFQLGHTFNGIETIQFIREQYNVDEEIPAVLVTADIASNDLIAVRTSGIPVMHKPVDTAALKRFIQEISCQTDTSTVLRGSKTKVPFDARVSNPDYRARDSSNPERDCAVQIFDHR